jgi:hypothetical protein
MRITRLRGGNAQFPEEKDVGDVVVFALGDIFCWDGGMWQLVGGRFIPAAMREDFVSYVSNGWPDASDARFDLPTLLDLSVFTEYGPYDTVPADKKLIERFISRVVEVAERCEKNLQAQRSE